MKKIAFFVPLLAIFLAGCQDNYRYPCQNPDNWDKQYCKKPWCSANGTCPEDLTHYEKNANQNFNQNNNRGVCR